MAITSINGYQFVPMYPNDISTTPNISTTQISILNSTYQIAYVFQVPKTGIIDTIMFKTGLVTTGCTLDIRLETIDSSGYPSGTLVDTDSHVTQVIDGATDDYTVFEVALIGSASVTQGDLVAVRFNIDSGTPSTLGLASFMDGGLFGAPTLLRSTNTGVSFAYIVGYQPICSMGYSDGSYPEIIGMTSMTDVANVNVSSATTPDSYGNKFQLPLKSRVIGYWTWQDFDGDFDLKIFDSSGVVTDSSISSNGNYPFYTSGALAAFMLPAPIELEAATDYILAFEKTDTTLSQAYSCSTSDIKYMEAFPSGGAFTYVTAKDPADISDFTETTTAMMFMGLIIDGFEVSSGGGGGQTGSIF